MASIGFYSALFLGTIIMIFGLIFKRPLSLLLGSTKTILPYSINYLKYILLGVPFSMTSYVMNNQLRFQGKAFYGMLGIGTGAIINIMLDPVFIFILGLDIQGAALATIISQIISFIILLIIYHYKLDILFWPINIKRSKRNAILTWRIIYFNMEYSLKHNLKKFLFIIILLPNNKTFPRNHPQWNTVPLPSEISSLGTICLNLAAHPYGDETIAAMSIVSRITYFVLAAMIGFGQGFQPVCGFNYGTMALRLQCLTFSLNGWITICNMMQQNLGKVLSASFLSMARQGILFIPFVYILPPIFGLHELFFSQPVADLLTFLIAIPLQLRVIKMLC